MLSCNRLFLPGVLASLIILAACGGSKNPPVTPPPSGGFSNNNLSGSYVFSTTGTVSDAASDFISIMGVFTSDGKGNITGGTLDQNSTIQGGLVLGAKITSGTYNVGADGRPTGSSTVPTGLITLQTDTAGIFQFNYVLTSSGHGLVTEFETFGTGSGTLDLQSTVTQADLDGQSYTFNLTGTSGFDKTICFVTPGNGFTASVPFATVGAFTLDSSGNISAGLEDFNNNCVSSGSTNVPVTGGGLTLGQQGFATASITTNTGTGPITYNFDVFPIDATHLKFIETDALPILVGDAFTQASSIPTGNNVFTVAGFDNSLSVFAPFTAAGILHTDGNVTILPDSVQDFNEVDNTNTGISSEVNFSGTYTALSGGRAELTLSGFINGSHGSGCGPCNYAIYPSSGGLQILEIDDLGSTNGIAYPQSATTLSSGEGFGMNLSGVAYGVSSANAEDDIAEFTNNNANFAGIIDSNDQGTTSFRNSFAASYSADTTVPGRGTVTAVTNAVNLTTYVVDSSTAVTVSTDPTFVGLGAIVQQNSSGAKSNVVANHLAVMRIKPSAGMNSSRKKAPLARPR
jgi:hypothetical protein